MPDEPHLPQFADVRLHGGVASVAVAAVEDGRFLGIDREGKAVRVVEPRVLCWTGVSAPTGDPVTVTEAVRAFEEAQEEGARRVDVVALWEQARGAWSEVPLWELAALVHPEPDGQLVSRVLRAIVADGLRFKVRASDVLVVPADQVEARLRREAERARDEALRSRFAAWMEGEGESPPEDAGELLEQLRQLAARIGQVSTRDPGVASMLAAGLEGTPAAALELLVRRGVLSEDENLLLIRLDLGGPFPGAALAEADGAAAVLRRALEDPGRRDLRALAPVTIDDAGTREIDDALSLEPLDDGGVRVGVHLAEPGALIEPGGAVDREARRRQRTLYLPDGNQPMLPPRLGEGAASLVAGEDRPAISVLIDLDREGRERGVQLCRSVVRVRAALPYDEVDRRLEEGGDDELAVLWRLSRVLREGRIAAGALETALTDIQFRVGGDGVVTRRLLDPTTPARKMVAEWMIRANRAAADAACVARLPVPYRSQELTEPPPEDLDPADRYQVYRATRGLAKIRIDTTPRPHRGLAVDRYLQMTSPLRRYLDLLAQRQLAALIDGAAAPLDEEGMLGAIAEAEPVLARGQIASAGTREFWVLRWIEEHRERPLSAVVLEVRRRRVRVDLLDLALRAWWRPDRPVEPGERLELRVSDVEARSGLLTLARDPSTGCTSPR